MKTLFRSTRIRTFSSILAVILAFPLAWKGLTGIYMWLSPFIMLSSGLALKSFALLNLLAFAVLIFIFFRKRWFCRYLCPAGWCFDRVSELNRRRVFTYSRFPYFGKWLAVFSLASAVAGIPLFIFLDPLAIFHGFFTVFKGSLSVVAFLSLSGFLLLLLIHLVFPGIWCGKLCPLGGLQMVMDDLKSASRRLLMKEKKEPADDGDGRRYFIMSGAGLLAGLMMPKFIKSKDNNIIRPPAAAEPALLYSLCSRCGSCNKVCPTGIIIPYTGTGNIFAWMTPGVIFRTGYCLETCNLCGNVCPTGAIAPFSTNAKNRLVMGIAEITLGHCLLFNNTECVKCRESCKYGAIDFIEQGSLLKMMPVVNKKKCVGCGACEVICREGCIKIKTGDFENQMNGLLT